jgi:hypothetical protein
MQTRISSGRKGNNQQNLAITSQIDVYATAPNSRERMEMGTYTRPWFEPASIKSSKQYILPIIIFKISTNLFVKIPVIKRFKKITFFSYLHSIAEKWIYFF